MAFDDCEQLTSNGGTNFLTNINLMVRVCIGISTI
jgi:hypothetical protein